MDEEAARALIAAGHRPTALHNNCSGKHAGLLLACRAAGYDPSHYTEVRHPLQREVLDCVAHYCGVSSVNVETAVDGCSLPVFRLPLTNLAAAYARLLARGAATPVERIRRAMWERPEMVAGRRRFTTDLLAAGPGLWIGKEGAEGVYAIGVAARRTGEKAIGIAFKIEDGSSRARDAIALAILDALHRLPRGLARRMESWRHPVLYNVAGRPVGRLQPCVALR
jgi:L-asparaginase II